MTRETWTTTDDRGVTRRLLIDYDAQGVARCTRETLHDLLNRAGMRQAFEVDA